MISLAEITVTSLLIQSFTNTDCIYKHVDTVCTYAEARNTCKEKIFNPMPPHGDPVFKWLDTFRS